MYSRALNQNRFFFTMLYNGSCFFDQADGDEHFLSIDLVASRALAMRNSCAQWLIDYVHF